MLQKNAEKVLNHSIYKLCNTMAKCYYNARMYEDLLQEGLLACYEAMEGYNPDIYNDPEQYFWFAAKRGMSDYYQRRSKLVVPPKGYREDTTDTPSLSNKRGSPLAYVDTDDCHGDDELSVVDVQRIGYEDQNHKQWLISRFFLSLSAREKQIINLRYYSDDLRVISCKNVGLLLDIPLSKTRVENIEKDIMQRFNTKGTSQVL